MGIPSSPSYSGGKYLVEMYASIDWSVVDSCDVDVLICAAEFDTKRCRKGKWFQGPV